MKLLIYGFGSFGRNNTNISQQIIETLPDSANITKVVLPVGFGSKILLDEISVSKPDFILGLGQYPRGTKIRIEKVAHNEFSASKTRLPKPITKNGLESVEVTLDIEPNNNSFVSHDAGRYFCNYSMYLLLTNSATKDIPFAFLHIPKKIDLDLATKFIGDTIKQILVKSRG